MMNLPRVKDGDAYTKRLHPISMNVYQSLAPLSTCNMELPPMDEVNTLDWVEIPTPDGKTEYYRVASVSTDMATGEKSVYLEHGACTLGDVLIPETSVPKTTTKTSSSGADLVEYPENKTDTIRNMLTYILSKQTTAIWSVGTVAADATIYMELGNFTLLDCLSSMMDYIPDYQMEFEQRSASDWRVNIKARPSNPVCECRLSRNLKTCDISYSTANICTRVYSEFLKSFPATSGGYMQNDNAVQTYGVHAETMTLNDNLTSAQKVLIIGTYLNHHCMPTVSIDISALELSQITGLDIDKFSIGQICRIAIPWLDIIVDEVIIDKQYSDCYNNPESVSLTLANATPDLAIAMAAITSNAGGAGASGRGGAAGRQKQTEKEKKRFETHFDQTDEYFRLLATDTQWDELGHGEVTAYGQLVVTSSSVQSVVSDIDGSGFSSITQLANSLELVVSKPTESDSSKIKAASIAAAINDQNESIVKINADRIYLDANKTFDVSSVFSVNKGSVVISKPFWIYNSTTGKTVTINNGSVNAPTLQVNSGGNLQFSPSTQSGTAITINHATAADIITGVQIAGPVDDVYTLQYQKIGTGNAWNNAKVTFSRATTLKGAWSSGVFTVSASPQDQYKWTSLTQGSASWSGKTVTIPIYATIDNGAIPVDTGKSVSATYSGSDPVTVDNWKRTNFSSSTQNYGTGTRTLSIPVKVDVNGVTYSHTFTTGGFKVVKQDSTHMMIYCGSTELGVWSI